MNAFDYLESVKLALALSDIVQTVQIVREYSRERHGFFRARLELRNGDFLEVSEFFVAQDDEIHILQYRYQWMDGARKQLRKRWDNATHHPELDNFPHHVHVKADHVVIPGQAMHIGLLLDMLQEELED